jgi:acetyltransferase-like isoleucine patch superfamily enzyme
MLFAPPAAAHDDLGDRALAAGVVVAGPVVGLGGARILGPCVLGHPSSDPDAAPLVLGEGVVVRAYAVLYQGSELGPGVHVGHGALVREGNLIGAGASIGSGAHLEPGNRVGPRTRIHSGGFLSNVILGADVFCGPHVTFTDDPHPPCPRYLDCVKGAVVEDGAVLGARAVLVPGVVVGAGSLVGAGSVVTRDVAPGDVVAGNPARPVGRRDELGCAAGFYDRAYLREIEPAELPGATPVAMGRRA